MTPDPMMIPDCRVFETGAGKWLTVTDAIIGFTSNLDDATMFSLASLRQANAAFGEFTIYRNTLRVVPLPLDRYFAIDCLSVAEYLAVEAAAERDAIERGAW